MGKLTYVDIPEITDEEIYRFNVDLNKIFPDEDIEMIRVQDDQCINIRYKDPKDDVVISKELLGITFYTNYQKTNCYMQCSDKIFEFILNSINDNNIIIPDFRYDITKHNNVGNFYFKKGLVIDGAYHKINMDNVKHVTYDDTDLNDLKYRLGDLVIIGMSVYDLAIYHSERFISFEVTKSGNIIINNISHSPYLYFVE